MTSRTVALFSAASALVLLAGCANDPRLGRDTFYLSDSGRIVSSEPQRGEPVYDNSSYWDGDGVQGAPSVVIRLGEQRAYFYKGDELVGVSVVSTGREGFNTPTGKFHIIQKDQGHVSSRFGDYVDRVTGAVVKKDADTTKDKCPPGCKFDGAKMPYFMRIVGGTGMHEGFLPGYAASHGCIRMPGFMAENFFRSVSLGTPVEITH